MTRLFTSETPSSGENSDGAPGITLGTAERFAVDGDVTGIWFYATVTVSGTYTVSLWDVTAADPNGSGGTLLASKTMAGAPTSAAWNYVAFDSPVTINTAKLYKASIFSGAGRYVLTPSYAFPATSGDITAPVNGTDPIGLGNLNQGSFTINSSNSYPTGGGGSCYFVCSEFVAAGGTTPVSSSLDLRWQVRETVSSSIDLRWAVKSVASAAVDLRWAVKSVASADLDARWAVKSVVSASLDARWALLASVSASLDLRWAQRALVEAPLDLRWSSAGRVISSIDLQWAVLVPVASALDLRWGVSVGVSAPLAVLWIVRERVAAPLELLWVSDAAPLSTERIPTDIRALLTQHIASNVSPVRIVYRR